MQFERVVVTGGCGRLGQYVVDEMTDSCHVTTLDLQPSRRTLPHLTVDILDLQALRRVLRGQDAVIHLAALDGHLDAAPERFMAVNALGTWNVLEAAAEAGVRKVVVASSNSAVGLSHTERRRGPLYLPIDEAHPRQPTHAYGLSKLMNEIAAESFARRNTVRVTCVRPTYIMFPELVPFIAMRLQNLGNSRPLTHPDPKVAAALQEPLSPLRCYIEPHDLARLFRSALEHDGAPYDLFYGCAADSFALQPTLTYVEETFGTLPEIRKPWVYETDPYAATIDSSHAREVLGWTPTSDWRRMSGLTRQA